MAKPSKPKIEESLVRKLADLLEETGLTEIEYGSDGLRIRVAKQAMTSPLTLGPSQTPTSEPEAVADSEKFDLNELSLSDHPGAVQSPMVGVVYTSQDPGSPPFVRPGEQVAKGQTLFLIEAMKVFNPITAPRAGTITHILVESEMPVEFGEPLAIIE